MLTAGERFSVAQQRTRPKIFPPRGARKVWVMKVWASCVSHVEMSILLCFSMPFRSTAIYG